MTQTLFWILRFPVISAIMMPDSSKGEIDESKALYYAFLISLLLAAITLLSRIIFGSFVDLTFEITLCYLPALLLAAVYIWKKFRVE